MPSANARYLRELEPDRLLHNFRVKVPTRLAQRFVHRALLEPLAGRHERYNMYWKVGQGTPARHTEGGPG